MHSRLYFDVKIISFAAGVKILVVVFCSSKTISSLFIEHVEAGRNCFPGKT